MIQKRFDINIQHSKMGTFVDQLSHKFPKMHGWHKKFPKSSLMLNTNRRPCTPLLQVHEVDVSQNSNDTLHFVLLISIYTVSGKK